MQNDFVQKRENKILRYRQLAEKNNEQANERHDTARKMQSCIPFGQPILIGHHSEKRHRAHLKRINGNYSKMSEHFDKAKYYEEKAISAANNKNIYIDDPQEEEKLEQKIVRLKALREAYKQFNKTWKKSGIEAAIEEYPGKKESIRFAVDLFCQRYNHETKQHEKIDKKILPGYIISNLTVNIRRYEQRFKTVKEVKEVTTELSGESLFESDTVSVKIEDGRVNIYFASIPEKEIREKIKRSPLVMKWSPTRNCWTRICSAFTQTNLFKQALREAILP